ncbi:MAG: hypothetical protein WCA32_18840 [Chromatiaceae bacterium]
MKLGRHLLLAAVVAATLIAVPEAVGAYWLGPGFVPWRHAYINDPNYRWGPPSMRSYIRDLYLYGPGYANWNRQRRFGWWW